MCPETTQLKKQLDQVRADMKTSLEKIEFYASKKRERQSDMINLAKNMAENHSWVQSVFQQSIQGAKSQHNYLAPCEINKGKPEYLPLVLKILIYIYKYIDFGKFIFQFRSCPNLIDRAP